MRRPTKVVWRLSPIGGNGSALRAAARYRIRATPYYGVMRDEQAWYRVAVIGGARVHQLVGGWRPDRTP